MGKESVSGRLHNIAYYIKAYATEVLIVVATATISFTLFHFTDLKYPNDDQFILYRYIDNIVEGQGFVYNIGEKVLGATTPLFTLLAAGLKFIFSDIGTPDLVAYLNIIFLSFSALFFYKVARFFLSDRWSIVAVAIFILNLSRTIPEGMETPLFILTVFVFLNFLFDKKYTLSAVWLSLTLLTRPDAGLIAIIAFIYWIYKEGWIKSIRYTTVTIIVALPWLIFATAYFGSFVPQSLLTKLHSDDVYHLPALQATKIQAAHISRIYWGKIIDPENIPLQTAVNLLPIFVVVIGGIKKRFNIEVATLASIPLVYFLSFSISNPIIFPWYLSQMEPFWILLSCIGFAFLSSYFNKPHFQVLLIVALLAGPLVSWSKTALTENQGTKINAFKVGDYIKTHMNEGNRIGLADIGIVGYITDAYIVDFIGLVRSDSVRFYPAQGKCINKNELYIIPPELIKTTKPEWLVAGDSTLDPCFVKENWFTEHYNLVYFAGGAKVWKLRK